MKRGKIMFCFKCGHNLTDSAEYCSKCGIYQSTNLNIDDNLQSSERKKLKSTFNELSSTQKALSVTGIIFIALILILAVSGGNSALNIFGNGVLNRPAVDYIMPGEASQTLQQVWGVDLNTSSGPVTLEDMADQAFNYTSRSVGGGITKSEVEIAFQPGNSMYSFFNRLLSSQDAVDAVRKRWISLAR